jgi:hypothetical protein
MSHAAQHRLDLSFVHQTDRLGSANTSNLVASFLTGFPGSPAIRLERVSSSAGASAVLKHATAPFFLCTCGLAEGEAVVLDLGLPIPRPPYTGYHTQTWIVIF